MFPKLVVCFLLFLFQNIWSRSSLRGLSYRCGELVMLSTLGCLVGPGVAGALGCVLLAGRTPVWFLGVLKGWEAVLQGHSWLACGT